MQTIHIAGATGASRILVGERLANLPAHLPPGPAVVITDENVARLYAPDFPPAPVIAASACADRVTDSVTWPDSVPSSSTEVSTLSMITPVNRTARMEVVDAAAGPGFMDAHARRNAGLALLRTAAWPPAALRFARVSRTAHHLSHAHDRGQFYRALGRGAGAWTSRSSAQASPA